VDYTFWIELLLFILLMGLSDFFQLRDRPVLSQASASGANAPGRPPRVDLIERMLEQPRRLIMTILIGNELVNVAASAISAAVVIRLLGAENKWTNL